ncbi:hypothetical protein WK90_19085 [Burkholderia cepacia]|nr:hypothetical protein WK83_10620 [Burkholderia cepacia]KVV68948.1 hypothetical protein WK85_21610 [Burkholderia cepacia]KVV69319.1 hypothetical protein WK84_18625 [Burkholderia cepacia]KVV93724.1 hypothetical protein WK87_10325 [Burkholderia cepacia]KVV97078.1 hypothetical protein WK88_13700 [Burkholderia cepacia]
MIIMTSRCMIPIEVPSFRFENAMQEIQICFALPCIRALHRLSRECESKAPLKLWILVEKIGNDLARSHVEPLIFISRILEKKQC